MLALHPAKASTGPVAHALKVGNKETASSSNHNSQITFGNKKVNGRGKDVIPNNVNLNTY